MSVLFIIQKQLLRLSAAIAMTLGLFVLASWIYPIPKRQHLEMAYHPVKQVQRKPSSIITLATPKGVQANLTENMITIKLNCKTNTQKLTSQARQVRLLFEPCIQNNQPRAILTAQNESNNYEATLFKLPRGGYSTDYIYLKEGTNKIKIEQSFSSDFKLVSELEIEKKSPDKTLNQ